MSFQQPLFLISLVVVPILGGLYVLAQGRRRLFTLRFTNLALMQSVVGRRPDVRRHLPPLLFLLGAAALLTGLAGPVLNLEVARNDASVMLVIDVSGSMQATDVQPTRLDAARSAARSLIDGLPAQDRVGLVSFNSNARLDAALTDNHQAVVSALDGLAANGGTAIGSGLALALKQLAPASSRASGTSRPASMIVLLTDGVSNAGLDPQAAADQARAAGIRVQAIGIGLRNASVRVRGQDVGGVDEQTLQSIASTTGGKYYYAEAAGQLTQIYSTLGSELAWRFVKFDATVPLLLTGIIVVLLGAGVSLVWFRVLP